MNLENGAGGAGAVPGEAASQKTLETIRQAAVEGLLALPRGGMGIGGFLLGIRRNGRMEILSQLEIPCAHALGPAFVLTSEELEHARRLKSAAAPLEILGVYVSITRGSGTSAPAELEASQLELFHALCPAPGSVALLVRPSAIDFVQAAIFLRTQNEIRLVQEWSMDYAAENTLADSGLPVLPGPSLEDEGRHIPAGHAAENGNGITSAPNRAPIELRDRTLPKPAPESPVERPSASRRNAEPVREREWRDGIGRKMLCAAVLVLLAAATLIVRGHRARAPQLKLHATDENGAIVFRWNPDGIAGAKRGRLLVNDSGQFSEFRLDARALASGLFRYARKSGRVIAKLAVGEREAHAVFFVASATKPGSAQNATSTAAPPRK